MVWRGKSESGPDGDREPLIRLAVVARIVARVLARVALVGGRRRGRRRGRLRGGGFLDEVLRLLVEAVVHVVAGLEDRRRAGAHDVVLGVVLRGEDGADRLAVL